jgi:hypothetical protein
MRRKSGSCRRVSILLVIGPMLETGGNVPTYEPRG